MQILVSAGDASGDRYAAGLVEQLRKRFPGAEFFGCAGRHLRQAGVEPIVRLEEIAVIGVFEVLTQIPHIYAKIQRLARTSRQRRPALAVVTDAPGFHIPVAKKLHRAGIPVFYYVAPQIWAWRRSRLRPLRRCVKELLCIFPFEEKFFRDERVAATFVGHPLCEMIPGRTLSREQLFRQDGLDPERPLIALLPGSRPGEVARHLAPLLDAVKRLRSWRPMNFLLPAASTMPQAFFAERIADSGVQVVEGDAQSYVAHADLALIASGTATVEAALLGKPMVVFYRVTTPTWLVGKVMVDIPFYSMVNLLAGKKIVPELIQSDCTGEKLAAEARRLLEDEPARRQMTLELSAVGESLAGTIPAAERAVEVICNRLGLAGMPASATSDSLAVL